MDTLRMSFLIMVISATAGSVSFISCSGTRQEQAHTDSIASDTLAEVAKKEIRRFPDTAYASAKNVRYTVSVADSSADGHLSSLDNMYADVPGSFTFRHGPLRDISLCGSVKGRPDTIVTDWVFTTGMSETWGGGSGWTGQPVYVHWPDSCMRRFRENVAAELAEDFGGREIIVGSLDGKVYFINHDTGRPSRTPIEVGNPVKGSVSLDPSLNGNLYVGHGVPDTVPFGALVADLYSHRISHIFDRDPHAYRGWGAYDPSPVRVGQFLFRVSENGSIYKYEVLPGSLRLHSVLRYICRGYAPGIESSMAVLANYGYVGDNNGNILCVNLDDLEPVWHYELGDDTDATPVVREENGKAVVYVACEVDRTDADDAVACIAKLDATDGTEIWRYSHPARMAVVDEKHFDGGFYATPLCGTGDCSDMIFANIVLNLDGRDGEFLAIDKRTGKEIYSIPLRTYAWSSPVGFTNESGEMFVFAADCLGYVYLIEGRTGRVICKRRVGANFESSPVVCGSSVVVGSRGDKIYKMTVQ